MQQLENRVAFITGGASGIGLGIAHALVDAGMKAVLADLRPDHIDTALTAFARRGQAAAVHAVHLDVTDRTAMAAAADEAQRKFGNVHVLVNNAGVGINGPFEGITYADWDFGLAVNLGGVINGLQTFVPMPSNFVVYSAAKAAVVSISETLRPDLGARGIGVTVLCPGPVRTHIHEVKANRLPQFAAGDAFRKAEENPFVLNIPGLLEPEQVGTRVKQAILEDAPYVITHGEWRSAADALHAARMAAMPTTLDPELLALLRSRAAPTD